VTFLKIHLRFGAGTIGDGTALHYGSGSTKVMRRLVAPASNPQHWIVRDLNASIFKLAFIIQMQHMSTYSTYAYAGKQVKMRWRAKFVRLIRARISNFAPNVSFAPKEIKRK
jgi:hypothetical protein